MTRFSKEDLETIIVGIANGKTTKTICTSIQRNVWSVDQVLAKLQKDKPLFQQIIDGKTPSDIAQKYFDEVTNSYADRARKVHTGIKSKKQISSSAIARIEEKVDRLLRIWEEPATPAKKSMFRLK